ncbi:family 16 glycosylhydrolase [Rubrobacter marinus]|uniref:Beta-glucanase n=1 Tax=Rubrobacter marinus TaxID=2653852 RepID=A0A6G8PZU2_9ACTN|nr:glycoside hydrolase family 16 protein [Rubrobacter marinus]QIN79715.1 family 16 glycosylhydrolase [Rubrobacter marinus]
MRRVLLVLFVSLLGATMMAGAARAGALDFTDDFDTFDETRWKKGSHNLGRSRLDPANVDVSAGNLRLKLPARTTNGGEIASNSLYGYGSYTARMKLPNAPSSITGFFLYEPPDYASEIDIEIFNDTSRRIMFSSYANGSQTHTQTLSLPFDPTTGFHDYRFDYAPGSLRFYADGVLMKEWTDGLPQTSMRLYANAWFPTWLDGRKPTKDKFVLVDSIKHLQQ